MHEAYASGRLLVAEVNGAAAAGLEILPAAGSGKKYVLFSVLITCDSAKSIAGSDGFGTHYAIAGVPIPLNYGPKGKKQDTHDTALTLTSSSAANVSAVVLYAIDQY